MMEAMVITELAHHYNPLQPRDSHGRWSSSPGDIPEKVHKFRHTGGKGSLAHARAIYHAGDYYKPVGDVTAGVHQDNGPLADMLSEALHNTAISVVKRDLRGANAHLDSAEWAAKHLGQGQLAHVRSIRESIRGIGPAAPSNRNEPRGRNRIPLRRFIPVDKAGHGVLAPAEPRAALRPKRGPIKVLPSSYYSGTFSAENGGAIELAAYSASVVPVRAATARRLRKLADSAQSLHPEMGTHAHLRDAANALERGLTTGASRHLDAAMSTLTPLSLYRHGIADDDGHADAKRTMNEINRHVLQLKDMEDLRERTEQSVAQRRIAKQPPPSAGNPAMNAPNTTNAGLDRAVAKGPDTPNAVGYGGSQKPPLAARPLKVPAALSNPLDLSAQTAGLVATPAPYGKPGGPGLYGVAGQKHSNYFEHVVQAMKRRGKSDAEASQMAWGILRRWARGGGNVHPEVKAAAAQALAEEATKHGSSHSNAADWRNIELAIEIYAAPKGAWARGTPAAAIEAANAAHWARLDFAIELTGTTAGAAKDPRVPAGQPGGGTFGSGGQQAKGKKGTGPGDKAGRERQKTELLARARSDRQRAHQLQLQLNKLKASQKASAASTAQATKAGSTGQTASSTPAKASSAPAAKASTTTAKGPTTAAQITKLRGQIHQLLTQAAALDAQAKKL